MLFRDELLGLDVTAGRDTVPADGCRDDGCALPERADDRVFPVFGELPAERTGSAAITMPFEDGRVTTGSIRVFPCLASER